MKKKKKKKEEQKVFKKKKLGRLQKEFKELKNRIVKTSWWVHCIGVGVRGGGNTKE